MGKTGASTRCPRSAAVLGRSNARPHEGRREVADDTLRSAPLPPDTGAPHRQAKRRADKTVPCGSPPCSAVSIRGPLSPFPLNPFTFPN